MYRGQLALQSPPFLLQIGKPLERIRVEDVLAALRGPRAAPIGDAEVARVVTHVMGEIDRTAAHVAEARNLRDLVEELGRSVDPSESGQ